MAERQQAVLTPKEQCTGCTACYSGCPKDAITMVRDSEGFLYPQIGEACIDCGHCAHICPAKKHREVRNEPAVFAAWLEDEELRRRSSAGGVFTALSEYVLELGGVVFGAALNEKMEVCHIAVKTMAELAALRGSKLVQSRLGDTFRRVSYYLEQGRQVLFSGTPCQIDGLYRYLGEHPENLLTCDILCSGVASPAVWDKLVESMAYIKRRHVVSVHFADKVPGESQRHFRVWFDGGEPYDAALRRSEFGRGFFRALFLRPVCHICPYVGTNRVGDLSLGVFGGLPKEYGEQQKKGVSLLLVNSVKGAHVFDTLPLHRELRTLQEAVEGNHALQSAILPAQERNTFFEELRQTPFAQVSARFFAPIAYRGNSIADKMSALKGKLWKKH